ncbi:MAG TPA: HPr family phosphocarrier protein [Candidatus Dorea gallistercoris]|uniref:HPr family phosphocarrier protein n=1 Tax=Candidatus Dorea gallistercoris TaxID=2838542 RepID=A0A9D1UE32_9FIRM|nr:HPr family phosphocarrier protein [Candidatus Dorea gallistercoris]
MIKKPVTIRTNMDMESRPIAHLVQEASQYASHVYIEMEDKKINAKSIMGMMSLDLLEGTSLTVVAEGEDEENAVNGVGAFLENQK